MEHSKRLVARLLALLIAFHASVDCLGKELRPAPSEPQERVVTADVVSATVVERLDGDVFPLAKWRVRVRDVKIINGPDPGLEGVVEFETIAGDISGWPEMGRIGLLVKYSTKRDVELLQWSPVYESVCFGSSSVVEQYGNYYDDDPRGSGKKCTSIRERSIAIDP